MVVIGQKLHSIILEVLSNLNGSMIQCGRCRRRRGRLQTKSDMITGQFVNTEMQTDRTGMSLSVCMEAQIPIALCKVCAWSELDS